MQKYKDELRIKKRRKIFAKLTLFLLGAVLISAGLIYAMFFASLLDVTSATVEGDSDLKISAENTVGEWLNSGFWQFKKKNNLFFLSVEQLSGRLLAQLPELESVAVQKQFPHSLRVSLTERKPAGVWCLSDSKPCFYFDKSGVAFSETGRSTGFLILNINDRRSREIRLGDRVASDDWLADMSQARELLSASGVSASEFVIPENSIDEFYVKTIEGWRIMFSTATDIKGQIGALVIFLKEKITPSQRVGLEYVDLRIQDRIYYK